MTKLVVVIPVWDRDIQHGYTARAVTELIATVHDDMVVVFVDNASPFKGTRELLLEKERAHPERIKVVCNEENRGYGGAANQGVFWGYQQGAEHFIVCNNDIAFLSPVWWRPLVERLEQKPDSLVGLRYITDNEWTRVYYNFIPYLEGFMLAFNRGFVEKIGYFDERFHPAWFEDVDLSWRVVENGYTLELVEGVSVFHAYGKTGYDGRLKFMEIARENQAKLQAKISAGMVERVGCSDERE